MTKENLEKANALKERIAVYTSFLDYFKPVDMTISAAIPGMDPTMYPPPAMPTTFPSKISLTASYIPSVITPEGTTEGKWEVVSASGITDKEILDLINELASLELSSIGGSIVDSVLEKISNMQTEFEAL